MRKFAYILIGSAVALAVAAPATAHPNNSSDRHYRQHDRLEAKHDRSHYRLDRAHDRAHWYGLTRREHRQVHRRLERAHDRADRRLERRHDRQHGDW